MIYLGMIHANNSLSNTDHLTSTLQSYTHTLPSVIEKKFITLSFGKLYHNTHTQDMDEILENESSVLIGRIFDKEKNLPYSRKDFINDPSQKAEDFLTKIWGKYVYIHNIKNTSDFEIIVDLTGQLPFFYYSFPNGDILFSSDIEIIFKCLSLKHEYNWIYLSSYFFYGNSSAVQTPFKDIYEVPPGCLLKITKNGLQTKPFWDPLQAYQVSSSQKNNPINILKSILKPWVAPYKNVCVSLSGGLDSSSLVYCLKDLVEEDQTLKAFNYYHSSVKASNELLYARQVCKDVNIDLIEIDASNCLPFDHSLRRTSINPNKPFPGLINLKWTETLLNHLPLNETCSILSGHGSDHIFMCPPAIGSLADYVLEKGFRGSKNKLLYLTAFYRDSFVPILKENLRGLGYYFLFNRLGKRSSKYKQHETPEWVNQGLYRNISSDFVHPIYESLPNRILPGKYKQIDYVYEGVCSVHCEMSPELPTHYPFFFEPVVNLALSIPSYDLWDKGYDRYPLRKSFSDHFAVDVAWRRDKGKTTGVLQMGVKKNLNYILSICMEGEFIKNDLIDKQGFLNTLTRISNGDNENIWPFLHLASAEIFLRYWNEKVS